MSISENQLILNEDIKYLLKLNLNQGRNLNNQKVSLNALYAVHFINDEIINLFNELFDLTKLNDPSLRLFNMTNIENYRYQNMFYYNHLQNYNKSGEVNHHNHNIAISQLLYNELMNNSQEFRQTVLENNIMTLFEIFINNELKNKLNFESYYSDGTITDYSYNKYIFIINDDELTEDERQELIIAINLFNVYYNQKNNVKSEEIRLEYRFNELNHLSQMNKINIYLKSTLRDYKKSDNGDNIIGYDKELSLQY